ncbi:hypothetical protein AgCh_022599 [Apium graveolens]
MDKRSKKKGSKCRPVALKVEEKLKEKSMRKSYSKGKAMIAKSNTELSNSDDDSNTDNESDTDSDHDNNNDMDQMAALLVKGFEKMVYKNFKKGRRFPRKDSTDCRKPRAEKKQALISKKKNWDDTSESDDEVNYALMANADTEVGNAKLKLPQTILAFDTDDIYELRLFLKSLHESLENGCWGSGLGYVDRSNSDKKIEKETEKNKPKQLKQKLKDLHMKDKKKRPRKNMNGKVGVNMAIMRNTLVLDSGCSGHMIGYKFLLPKFEEKVSPSVTYGDGNLGKILGCGKIKVRNVIIENVALVAGLKHNLISVSQICDRGNYVKFYKEHCEIVSKSDGKIAMTAARNGSLYEGRVSTNTDVSEVCLLSRASVEDSWNWHKRLSHLNFNNINELVKKYLVRGFSNAVFTPDGLCDSCQKVEQRKISFKSKTESSILEPYHC